MDIGIGLQLGNESLGKYKDCTENKSARSARTAVSSNQIGERMWLQIAKNQVCKWGLLRTLNERSVIKKTDHWSTSYGKLLT